MVQLGILDDHVHPAGIGKIGAARQDAVLVAVDPGVENREIGVTRREQDAGPIVGVVDGAG